jgi:hypothetical protein
MSSIVRPATAAIVLALALGLSSCNPLGMLPVDERTFRSDSDEIVGRLTWRIVDCQRGDTVLADSQPLFARDVAITQMTQRDGSINFDKRIELGEGFYFTLAEFPETSAEDLGGFGLMAGCGDGDFSWEWFDLVSASHARKLQESGDLKIAHVQVGTRWELGRMDFESDVSLRVYDEGLANVARNRPHWRIRIERGSYVQWPSVVNGNVVTYNPGTPPAPPN